MSKMQTSLDTTASMNSIGYCESIDGLVVPLVLGEAIDSFAHNSGDDVGDFSTTVGSYPRICSVVDSFPLIRSISTVANGRCDRNGIMNSGTSCGTDYISGAAGEGIWKSSIANAPDVDGTVIWRRGGVVQPVQLEGSCSRLPGEPTMIRHRALSCGTPGFSLFSEELSFNVENRNCTREQGLEIRSSSRAMFLQAMQEILGEIALHTFESAGNENGSSKCHQEYDSADNIDPYDDTLVLQDRHHVEIKKKHLLALLQLVNDGYAQCLHEIHMVSSAFHVVTELDPNLHTRFALRTISLMYKNLRERISSHIVPTGAHLAEGQPLQESEQSNTSTLWSAEQRWVFQQQLGKRDRHLWRPQRGLPEQSVSVLRTWMFQNFLHPYPKDGDKQLLALKSGLTRNQVSNWFINARVRLWKPMIEEMYAELNKRKQYSK